MRRARLCHLAPADRPRATRRRGRRASRRGGPARPPGPRPGRRCRRRRPRCRSRTGTCRGTCRCRRRRAGCRRTRTRRSPAATPGTGDRRAAPPVLAQHADVSGAGRGARARRRASDHVGSRARSRGARGDRARRALVRARRSTSCCAPRWRRAAPGRRRCAAASGAAGREPRPAARADGGGGRRSRRTAPRGQELRGLHRCDVTSYGRRMRRTQPSAHGQRRSGSSERDRPAATWGRCEAPARGRRTPRRGGISGARDPARPVS